MTVIEVYADIWCPFAHVGLRAVIRWRKQLGRDDVVLRVRPWPLELVNGVPLEPAVTAVHVDELRTQVAPDLFTEFDPGHFPPTTLPALALAEAGYRRDDMTGEAVSLALRDALFEEGRDVSSPAVLASVESAYDLSPPDAEDEGAVRIEWHEGESRGVKGSPHFFCGKFDAFCPSLDISRNAEGQLLLHRNVETLDAFLAKCLQS